MADFGEQNQKIVTMWEHVKNTALPVWAYVLIVLAVVFIIAAVIVHKVHTHAVKKRRKQRKKEREARLKLLQAKSK